MLRITVRFRSLLSLRLKDLDLQRQVAILRETKNKETRKVPIVHYLKDVLVEHLNWRETYAEKMPEGSKYLFPRDDGRLPIDIRKAWENARDKAGIIDFRFHDLRRKRKREEKSDVGSLTAFGFPDN
ncbi:MAG: tyrosine-type recombinase/integrase [Pseudomonadales bacterium]|nr:tyrosine-type recombinase/integrase [Pseudomonadales bacterium]